MLKLGLAALSYAAGVGAAELGLCYIYIRHQKYIETGEPSRILQAVLFCILYLVQNHYFLYLFMFFTFSLSPLLHLLNTTQA